MALRCDVKLALATLTICPVVSVACIAHYQHANSCLHAAGLLLSSTGSNRVAAIVFAFFVARESLPGTQRLIH